MVGLGLLFEWLSLDAYPAALVAIMAGIVVGSFWVPNAQPLQRPNVPEQGGFLQQLRRPGILAFYLCVALMQLDVYKRQMVETYLKASVREALIQIGDDRLGLV